MGYCDGIVLNQANSTMFPQKMIIKTVTNDGQGASQFGEKTIELNGDEQRRLSEQITAINFRLRSSGADYESGFHVAGDPTLLIILQGTFRVTLRNGDLQDFTAGQCFIAEDYLADGITFSDSLHGHKGQVVGDVEMHALHLKLSKR